MSVFLHKFSDKFLISCLSQALHCCFFGGAVRLASLRARLMHCSGHVHEDVDLILAFALQAQEAETRRAGRREGRSRGRPIAPAAPAEVAFGGVGVKPGVRCALVPPPVWQLYTKATALQGRNHCWNDPVVLQRVRLAQLARTYQFHMHQLAPCPAGNGSSCVLQRRSRVLQGLWAARQAACRVARLPAGAQKAHQAAAKAPSAAARAPSKGPPLQYGAHCNVSGLCYAIAAAARLNSSLQTTLHCLRVGYFR
jgi:hypothetical protein